MAAVVDIATGDVLASRRSTGRRAAAPARRRVPATINRPLMELFEPGSTNKLITLSTAIEAGHRRSRHHDQRAAGAADRRRASSRTSIRTATSRCRCPTSCASRRTSARSRSRSTCRRNSSPARCVRSGSGRATAVDFPGQAVGLLLDPSEYYDTGLASTSIGYGVAVTGMQMLDAYATIANGGVTRPPRLLDATIDSHGERHPTLEPRGRRVVSAATATDDDRDAHRGRQRRDRRVRGDPRIHRRRARPERRARRSTVATRTARWRRSSDSRRAAPALRGDRRARRADHAIRWRRRGAGVLEM